MIFSDGYLQSSKIKTTVSKTNARIKNNHKSLAPAVITTNDLCQLLSIKSTAAHVVSVLLLAM